MVVPPVGESGSASGEPFQCYDFVDDGHDDDENDDVSKDL